MPLSPPTQVIDGVDTWDALAGKPTTIAGFGITDALAQGGPLTENLDFNGSAADNVGTLTTAYIVAVSGGNSSFDGGLITTNGFGGFDIGENLTVDGNIDLADHYFLIDSTTGYITSSQNYVPFGVVVEATQGLTIANGLAFDSINSVSAACDISAATVAGNLMSGLFDGTGNVNASTVTLAGSMQVPAISDIPDFEALDINNRIAFASDGTTQVFSWATIDAFKASVITSNFTSDIAHFVDGTGAFQTIASIGTSQKLVSNSAPTTGQTVSAAGIHQDELIYVQPVGTLLALTIQLEPGGGVIADIGDVKEIFISQIITGLTVSATGGTVRGTALTTSSAVNGSYEYIKVTTTDWLRIR